MSDFITERDPIIVFNPPPNFRGRSPEEIALKEKIQKLEAEHLKLCDTLGEMEYFSNNSVAYEKYQNTIKEINAKSQEITKLTKTYMDLEVNNDKSME